MCTAITYQARNHYFGRNLDLHICYQEAVTIMPRNFPLAFRMAGRPKTRYAMIGMATVADGYPLFYDATNEKGLSMAGLNFPDNAFYRKPERERDNVATFELIPWILGQCADLAGAKQLLSRINITDMAFSSKYPAATLHWIVADESGSLVVESVKEGIRIYENPVGVLTNNPPFDFHMQNLNHYLGLAREEPENTFSERLKLSPCSLGLGSVGLPGDWSSVSRFVRAAFVKENMVPGESESQNVGQFFHILDSVAQPKGCVRSGEKDFERTIYSSCCNTDKGIYYYKTYENSQITRVDMHRENLDSGELVCYPLITEQQIRMQN